MMRQTGTGGTGGQADTGWAHSFELFGGLIDGKTLLSSSPTSLFLFHPPYSLFLIIPGRKDLAFTYAQATMNAQVNLHILEFH